MLLTGHRTENIMLYKQRIPHDRRFESINANFNLLSKYQTQNVAKLENYSPRRELFTSLEE